MSEATHLVFYNGEPHLCRAGAFRDFSNIPDCVDPDNAADDEKPRWRLAWCKGEEGAFICWDCQPDNVVSLTEIQEYSMPNWIR